MMSICVIFFPWGRVWVEHRPSMTWARQSLLTVMFGKSEIKSGCEPFVWCIIYSAGRRENRTEWNSSRFKGEGKEANPCLSNGGGQLSVKLLWVKCDANVIILQDKNTIIEYNKTEEYNDLSPGLVPIITYLSRYRNNSPRSLTKMTHTWVLLHYTGGK